MLFQQQSDAKSPGLFPRISNLRNEVTSLFKNSNSNPASSKMSVGSVNGKPMSSPRLTKGIYNSDCAGQRTIEKGHGGSYASTTGQSIIEGNSKNRKRFKSNHIPDNQLYEMAPGGDL